MLDKPVKIGDKVKCIVQCTNCKGQTIYLNEILTITYTDDYMKDNNKPYLYRYVWVKNIAHGFERENFVHYNDTEIKEEKDYYKWLADRNK